MGMDKYRDFELSFPSGPYAKVPRGPAGRTPDALGAAHQPDGIPPPAVIPWYRSLTLDFFTWLEA